jgi:arginyl-tRNA synthetase
MDAFFWESQVDKDGLKIAKQLLKKRVLKESEGAIIADLNKYGLGVVVAVSKDGLPLYFAKDFGLAKLEFNKYKVSKVIHVVATEQTLYFKQLFKIFEKAGWKKWAKNSIHLAYELVDLKEGKMSSRSGDIVLFTELYEKMFDVAMLELQKRNPELNEKKRKSIAHEVTISALKYGMLSQNINKKILFDYKDWLAFEGNTGPYIQYSYVRAKKILDKLKKAPKQKVIIEKSIEYELIKKLNEFSKVFEDAYEKLDPSEIAHYAYELAFKFSKFYEKCPVIKSEYAGSRAKIVKAYLKVL